MARGNLFSFSNVKVLRHCEIFPILRTSTARCYATRNHRDAHLQVVEAIRSQTMGHNKLSNYFIVDTLRSCYPEHILTQTTTSTGLTDLAEAGQLTAQLNTTIPYYSTRIRKPDLHQVTTTEDLKDDVHFGRYDCHWKGCDFYMYEAKFPETEYSDVSNHYVLFPFQHAQESNGRSLTADELLVAAFQHSTEINKEIWLFDDGYWRRSKKLWHNVENASWSNVILSKELSQDINTNISSFFDRKDLYKSFEIPWKRGIILHGLPGNGKTISIKAIMRSLSLRSFPIPTLYVKSLGQECTHNNIRAIFEKAREVAPCLLVFEDLDSLVTDNVRSFFLNEVDGLEANDGILMLGSTNYLDRLDLGISKRPSRFDRKYHFPLPAIAERLRYCEYWRLNLVENASIDFPPELCAKIAEASEGLSFAYLQEIFVASMFTLMQRAEATTRAAISTELRVSDFSGNSVWQAVSAQIAKIRKELEDGKKSIEDTGKNSVVKDAASESTRPTGFAR